MVGVVAVVHPSAVVEEAEEERDERVGPWGEAREADADERHAPPMLRAV